MGTIQTSLNVSYQSTVLSTQARSDGRAGKTAQARGLTVASEQMDFSFKTLTHTRLNLTDQNALFHFNQLDDDLKSSLTYQDRPISDLSPDEAAELISADGYFGVEQTAGRIIDFVLKGAGDDLERLKQGREGILKGFREAEKLWGGTLPGISYDTLEKSLEAVDERIRELGGSVVDLSA